MTRIAVLGAGSWGTALALQLARNNLQISLWGHLAADIRQLQHDRENRRFLPGFRLPENIHPLADLQHCVSTADEILIVVPSHAFADVCQSIAPLLPADMPISWATKGLAPQNQSLLSDVCLSTLGPDHPLAVISGPTFAREVAQGLPTAIVIASEDENHAERLAGYFSGHQFRPYMSHDMIGVQVGGAAKNIMAIAAGIADGLGFGANSRAALIARGLAEISRFGVHLGGSSETFMGLAGLGDLILTCTDDQSRNRRFGLALARGESIDAAREAIGQEVEGIGSCREIYLKSRQLGIEMPITEQTYAVLFEQQSPPAAVEALLSRSLTTE